MITLYVFDWGTERVVRKCVSITLGKKPVSQSSTYDLSNIIWNKPRYLKYMEPKPWILNLGTNQGNPNSTNGGEVYSTVSAHSIEYNTINKYLKK